MANVRKRISELTPLTSASLDTTIVGVDNGTTYKIELDTLADAVTSRVNILDRSRLSSLESVTSSFETKGRNVLSSSIQLTSSFDLRYVLSGSITQTTWDNIENKPNDIISSSQQITDLGFISSSVDIADFTFTSETISNNNIILDANQNLTLQTSNGDIILNPDGNVYIGSTNAGNGIVTDGYLAGVIGDTNRINNATGNTITDNLDNIINSIPSISELNAFTQSANIILENLELATGSYLTSLSGAISGAGQIADLGFVTGSYAYLTEFNSLTQSFNIISGSVVNITNAVDVTQLNNTTESLNLFTQSTNVILNNLESYTSSLKNAINVSGIGTASVTTIYGNLHIEGVTTTTSASNLEIQNNFIYLNNDNFVTNPDLGIAGNYNDGTYAHSGIFSDASDNHTWKVFKGYTLEPSQSIDTNDASFQLADFKANKIYGEINATNNVISSSTQISTFGFISTSVAIPVGTISGSSQLSGTTIQNLSGSFTGSFRGDIVGSLTGTAQYASNVAVVTTNTTNDSTLYPVFTNTSASNANNTLKNHPSGTFYYDGVTRKVYAESFVGTIESNNGLISGSSQLTSSFDIRYAPSASYLTSLNGAFSSSIQTLGGSGVYSSSAQLPSGLISGSSQLTASYDARYTLSGSVSAVPAGTISGSAQITAFGFVSSSTSVPAGTISGSSQLTSSFDGRYVQTGSFNTLTASFNSFTASAQAVTTGSNSFNGTQTITGSLIITTGSFVGSQILANTSSLYLTSGSNMYVQNNGVVEITGSLKVSGSAAFNVSALSVDGRGGDEGGEINLAIPVTNTSLQNRVTVDVWQNRFRVFEGSANSKGVFVDLSKAPAGVGGELMWKASGLVNLGVDVTLGDLKARLPSTGNKSLQLSTTSAGVTYSVYGSGIYTQAGSTVGTTINASSPLSVTSTPAYLASGYNFGTAGATDTWVIMDTSNTIAWRITMILGSGFNNNMISIERLV